MNKIKEIFKKFWWALFIPVLVPILAPVFSGIIQHKFLKNEARAQQSNITKNIIAQKLAQVDNSKGQIIKNSTINGDITQGNKIEKINLHTYPSIKTQPEEAIRILDDCIVSGYEVKDKIRTEYYSNKEQTNEKIPGWQNLSIDWTNKTIQKLETIFVSKKELYNFRDAQPPFGATPENVRFVGIVSHLQARIDKLNEYDKYIRNQFNVKLEVVGRDKIIQQGNNGQINVNN